MKKLNFGKWLCFCMVMIALQLFLQSHGSGIDWSPLFAVTLLPATALQEINLLTEQAWTPNQREIETSQIDARSFSKQLAEQKGIGAPLVQKITDPSKDYDVNVWWKDFCGQEAEDCEQTGAELCGDLTGEKTPVEKKEYAITQCLNDKFSISENEFAGSWMDFRDFLVAEQNQRIIHIINKLNEKYLIFLHANAGLNKGGQWSQDAQNKTEVGAGEFNDTLLVTKLLLDAEINNIRNPFIITGDPALFITINNSRFQSGNAEGKGDAARIGVFDTTMDVRGFLKVPQLAGSTFVVTPYAAAFVSKNYYQNSVPEYDPTLEKWKYHVNIPSFGIQVDVLHQRICVDAAKDRYDHVFNYRLHYDFLSNPNGCLDDATGKRVTGIIEYQNTGVDVGSS